MFPGPHLGTSGAGSGWDRIANFKSKDAVVQVITIATQQTLFIDLLPANMESTQLTETVPATCTSSVQACNLISAEADDAVFLCHICLGPVRDRDPVVTQCGHLYCWPCLYEWLSTDNLTCPVCRASVSQDNVIPIFVKGNTGSETTRENIPSRPLGRRAGSVGDAEPQHYHRLYAVALCHSGYLH
jgi:hypothetical protein